MEELLSTQHAMEVRKLPWCKGETFTTSNTAVVTFLLLELSSWVSLEWEEVPVRINIPRPTQCFRCQWYGHTTTLSNQEEACSSCSPTRHQHTPVQEQQEVHSMLGPALCFRLGLSQVGEGVCSLQGAHQQEDDVQRCPSSSKKNQHKLQHQHQEHQLQHPSPHQSLHPDATHHHHERLNQRFRRKSQEQQWRLPRRFKERESSMKTGKRRKSNTPSYDKLPW